MTKPSPHSCNYGKIIELTVLFLTLNYILWPALKDYQQDQISVILKDVERFHLVANVKKSIKKQTVPVSTNKKSPNIVNKRLL